MQDIIVQTVIVITGLTTIWLSQDSKYRRRKYACIFGLVGEPFWLYAMYTSQQWGMLILSIFYGLGWIRGFYNFWIVKST